MSHDGIKGNGGFKKSPADIGPHNFKDHFDSDILDWVCEDVRLSTLQRKLVRESNTLVAHALACQVKFKIVSFFHIFSKRYEGHSSNVCILK